MTTTVVAIASVEPVVLTPDVAAALQAALAYLTANKQAVAVVQGLVNQAQNAEAGAQAAEDQAQALLGGAAFANAVLTLMKSLPTTRPTTGNLWNNNGALSLS